MRKLDSGATSGQIVAICLFVFLLLMRLITTSSQMHIAKTSGSSARKPLRADAKRNRARILEAADMVFASKGMSASTEEIARQAGVGIGTVFRHFPTKESLMDLSIVFDGLRPTESRRPH